LKDYLERAYGREARDRYWTILEDLFLELGYRHYGALQRVRMSIHAEWNFCRSPAGCSHPPSRC